MSVTVRDLILALSMFDPEAEVVVDDIGGSGCMTPPVIRLTECQDGPDVVEILTPGTAAARDEFRAGRS